MSIFHGIEQTLKTKVGDGSVYSKRIKFCRLHGHIDLFLCGGVENWERIHQSCGEIENENNETEQLLECLADY